MSAHAFQPDSFENLRNRIAARGCGSKRQIDYTEPCVQPLSSLFGDKLSRPRYLKRRTLDCFGKFRQIRFGNGFNGVLNYARTRHADVNYRVAFAYAVESARHKGVVLHRITENNKFCATEAVFLGGRRSGIFNYLTHQPYGVHIYARLGRADVDRRTEHFRTCQYFGYAL